MVQFTVLKKNGLLSNKIIKSIKKKTLITIIESV